jgi:hypothetical protein
MISFRCPKCDKRFQAVEAAAGTAFTCECGHAFTVPSVVPVEEPKVRCAVCGEIVPESKTAKIEVEEGRWSGGGVWNSGRGGLGAGAHKGKIYKQSPVCSSCRSARGAAAYQDMQETRRIIGITVTMFVILVIMVTFCLRQY